MTSAQDAAVIDAHVVPRYASLFGRMLLSHVGAQQRLQVLDIGCGTGHPSLELLSKLPEGSRVIAIDPDPILIDYARLRARRLAGKNIFFQVASAESLKFGDEVFDLVIGNLVLKAFERPDAAVKEVRRVLAPGGQMLLSVALEGAFEEVFDMFRELALKRDDKDLAARVERIAGRYPKAATLVQLAEGAGFVGCEVHSETFQLPFGRAHEILVDPMMRFVAVPEFRWIAGFGADSAQLLEQALSALDTYFGHGPVSLSVPGGVLRARK